MKTKNTLKLIICLSLFALSFTSCKKDKIEPTNETATTASCKLKTRAISNEPNNISTLSYNSQQQLIGIDNPSWGNDEFNFTYEPNKMTVRIISAGIEQEKFEFTYNTDGRCIQQKQWDGGLLEENYRYTLDANGYCIKEENINEAGDIIYETTDYIYANNNLIRKQYSGFTTEYTYGTETFKVETDWDKIFLNHKASTNLPASKTDGNSTVSYTYVLDADGKVNKMTEDYGSSTASFEYTYTCN
jgi:hypothetical protein